MKNMLKYAHFPHLLQDTVALRPSTFSLPAEQAIINELNKKYANRVLHDVGLCICVFDIAQAGEGKVRYGDGCLWHKGTQIYTLVMHGTELELYSCFPNGCISTVCW